jgi:hypothetical protein
MRRETPSYPQFLWGCPHVTVPVEPPDVVLEGSVVPGATPGLMVFARFAPAFSYTATDRTSIVRVPDLNQGSGLPVAVFLSA